MYLRKEKVKEERRRQKSTISSSYFLSEKLFISKLWVKEKEQTGGLKEEHILQEC